MTTEQMIRGIYDLEARNIPVECIYDMAPIIGEMLTKLKAIEDTLEKIKSIKTNHRNAEIHNLYKIVRKEIA